MGRARPISILAWSAVAAGLVVAVALLGLAVFPYGWLKPNIEAHLSRRFGVPVTIGAVRRLDGVSFAPEIAVEAVRVPQPRWVGAGDLLRLREARLRLPVLPLLLGRVEPRDLRLTGLDLALVRTADGRENWRTARSGGQPPSLAGLSLADGHIAYRDAKRDRSLDVVAAADPVRGVRIGGTGAIHGAPMQVTAAGAGTADIGRPWPFRLRIDGRTLGMTVAGTMARPLDPRRMDADFAARADNLKTLDAVIEAGLFGTQPIDLCAHIVHDGETWRAAALHGTIGRSRVSGAITVRKGGGRTRLDGAVTGGPFDFGDLASDEGKAKARAITQRIGPRLVPGTRVDLAKLGRTDGTIRFRLTHLVGSGSPPIASVEGVATLDHSRLVVSPLRIGLSRGHVDGRVVLDQRGGRPLPLVTIDLAIADTTLDTLAGSSPADGAVRGRIHLAGTGATLRAAVARSDGMVGLAARDGSLPASIASLLGFDIGRGITTPGDRRAALRCAVLRLDVRSGTGAVDPLLIDTTRGQTSGTGTISLDTDAIAIRLTGAPKRASLLRYPHAALLGGTIQRPRLVVPPKAKTVGNVLKAIGQTITGTQAPAAQDADCSALAARALR